MTPQTCSRCGNAELLEGVRISVATGGSTGEIQAVVTPTTGMFRQQTGSEMRAWVCAACGFSEVYVMDPHALAERWRAGER